MDVNCEAKFIVEYLPYCLTLCAIRNHAYAMRILQHGSGQGKGGTELSNNMSFKTDKHWQYQHSSTSVDTRRGWFILCQVLNLFAKSLILRRKNA